jgi:hypothetical protein
LKINLKCRHFDTVEVMEAESEAVLNTLAEHDFQDALEIRQKRWEWCIRAEGDYVEGDGGSRPKVNFWQRVTLNKPTSLPFSLL